MRGFDKLEEGRSRVLVYQVGSNRLYTRMLLDGCIRWIVRWILIRSQWIHLYHSGCQQSLLDPSGSQLDPVGSMCILGGSMYILVDLSWIHVYPVVSSWILVYLSRAFIDLSISITRSLQILVDLQYIHLYLYIPTLSLSIHSYPLLSTLSIYSISFNIHSMQQIYFAFFIKALLNMRIFRIFPLFTSRKLLQPIKSIQNTSIPLIDIIPINWNSFQSSCTCHHVHPSFFSKSLLINVDDSIQYNNQLLFFLFIV